MSDAEAVQQAQEAVDVDKQPLTTPDVDLLYDIYMNKRIQAQIGFYDSRIRENQLNADFTFGLGALVMTLSSLVATISASSRTPVLGLLAAILPAFAALLASFRQLYGWERQTNIYRDALMGLERVRLIAPDADRRPLTNINEIYPDIVTSGEKVFTAEVNQWGQFVLNITKEEAETAGQRSLQSLLDGLDLNEDQRRILAAIISREAPRTETISAPPAVPVIAAGTVRGTASTVQYAPGSVLPPSPSTPPVTLPPLHELDALAQAEPPAETSSEPAEEPLVPPAEPDGTVG